MAANFSLRLNITNHPPTHRLHAMCAKNTISGMAGDTSSKFILTHLMNQPYIKMGVGFTNFHL